MIVSEIKMHLKLIIRSCDCVVQSQRVPKLVTSPWSKEGRDERDENLRLCTDEERTEVARVCVALTALTRLT